MPFVLARLPENDDELAAVVTAMWGVTIPRHTCGDPGHTAPFTAFADAYFNRGPSMTLWHGSRGFSGKSFMLSILGITKAFLLGCDVNLLGGSLAQSTNIHLHMRNAMDYKNSPRYMIETESQTLVKLTNLAHIRPLTASQKTVRGPHPPLLLCMAEGTLVDTPSGPKEIQSVEVGHIVYASGDMGTLTDAIVTRKTRSGYQATIILETTSGSIACTPEHRFWTDRGWAEAQHLTPEDVLSVLPADSRQRWEEDRDVPGVLGGAPAREQGRVPVPSLRGATYDVPWNAMQGVPQRQQEGRSLVLSGLRSSTQAADDEAMPPLSSEVDVVGHGRVSVFGGEGYRKDWDQEVQGRGAGSGTAGLLGDQVHALGPMGKMGAGLRVDRQPDSYRGSRGLLARSSEERREGPEEENDFGAGWVSSPVLEDGSDPLLVEGHVLSIRQGPVVMTWDLTTTTGNFFVSGVLAHNCDEIDEMDQEILDAALGQPMPQKNYLGEILQPYTILCSTWQWPDKTFAEMHRRFVENGTPIVQWCMFCSANPIDGWLTMETIEEKKKAIPEDMWRTEYLLGEPSIGNRAFNTEAVEKMFSLPMEPITEKIAKDFEEYTFAEYSRDGDYVAAADWGKEQDYTVISVWRQDRNPYQLVYYMRVNRRPYPQMIGWFNDAIQRYSASAIHDGTGLGNVVNDYVDTRARSFIMTGEKRANMLSEYVNAVEKGQMSAPRIKTAYFSHRYCQVGDLYKTGQEFHLPDEVCSFSLAFKVMGWSGKPVGPVDLPRDNTPSKLEQMFSPVNGEVYIKSDARDPDGISLMV
jgi:hypothetical protein